MDRREEEWYDCGDGAECGCCSPAYITLQKKKGASTVLPCVHQFILSHVRGHLEQQHEATHELVSTLDTPRHAADWLANVLPALLPALVQCLF